MNHGTATVMTQLRSRHRRALQVPPQVFHATLGTAGLFGKMDLPVALVLRLQVALPLALIADVTMTGQGSGFNAVMAGAQQTNDGTAPDGFDLLFFEEQVTPDAVFDIEAAAGNGDVDVRVLIELVAVSVERTEYANFDAQLACLSMAQVAQRNRSLSSDQLLLKNGHSKL